MRYPGTVALLAGAVLAAGLPGCNQLAGHMANRRGKALYQRGEIAAAADEFRRATLDDPADPDYRHNLAAATDKLAGAGRSEMLYRQALTLNPDHQPTVHKLAELYLNTGRPDAARELTANWAAVRPGDPRPYLETAFVQSRTGDLAGAERSLKQALAVEPGHAIALANLADLQRRTGRVQQAAHTAAAAKQNDWTVKTTPGPRQR